MLKALEAKTLLMLVVGTLEIATAEHNVAPMLKTMNLSMPAEEILEIAIMDSPVQKVQKVQKSLTLVEATLETLCEEQHVQLRHEARRL